MRICCCSWLRRRSRRVGRPVWSRGTPSATRAPRGAPELHPSIGWATYKVSTYPAFTTQAQARRAVQIERRLELGMEGQRFFDLRRYGQAIATATINDYLTVEKTRRPYKTAQLPFAVRNMYYPIPPIEIDLSKVGGQERLSQNTGWCPSSFRRRGPTGNRRGSQRARRSLSAFSRGRVPSHSPAQTGRFPPAARP